MASAATRAAPARPAPSQFRRRLEQGREGQRDQQDRRQQEGVDDEHEAQSERCAEACADQVVAVNAADLAVVQDEDQADVEAGEEEEGQQSRVIKADVLHLIGPGGGVLKLQRVEGVGRDQLVSDGRRDHHGGGEDGAQDHAVAGDGVAEQGDDHAAEGEPGHDDGDDPVAVLRPFRDGEVAGQGVLDPDHPHGDQEERDQGCAGFGSKVRGGGGH